MTSPTLTLVQGYEEEIPLAHWTWRDRKGNLWDPSDMTTKHLFFTVRAVWNSVMDPDMRVGEAYVVYDFKYPAAYMRAAVAILGQHLINRPDMELWQKGELMNMLNHFIKNGWMERRQTKSFLSMPSGALAHMNDLDDGHEQWGD